MKKLLLMLIGALIALPALALDFEYTHEGQTLKYSTTSDTEVSVYGYDNMSDNVGIPASFKYNDTEYRVTTIGSSAFYGCSGLTSVYYNTEEPIIGPRSIFDCDNDRVYQNATLNVPNAAVDKCKEIHPWKNFMNIEAYAFSGIEDVNFDIDMDAPYASLQSSCFSCLNLLNKRLRKFGGWI